MFIIKEKDKRIILTRGDTASMGIKIGYIDGKPYHIQDTDIITLTVRKTTNSPIAIQKVATDKQFVLYPDDTKNLTPGLYVYDVQLDINSNIYTIISGYFELTSEVTY